MHIDAAVAALRYVTPDVIRYYFAMARRYSAQGVIDTRIPVERGGANGSQRLEIVDLASLPEPGTRRLVAGAVLRREWSRSVAQWESVMRNPRADSRVPTFIIVDEAHNLMPSEPSLSSEGVLIELFRTIAAEGRKYNLFLIIVTQRPDKVDLRVVSECANKIVMRVISSALLEDVAVNLGLEDVPKAQLQSCLRFPTGRGILAGTWAPAGPQMFYCAARRTAEGATRLPARNWLC